MSKVLCPICEKEKEKVFIPYINAYRYKDCQCEIDIKNEQRKKDIESGRNNLYFKYVELCNIEGIKKNYTFSSFYTDNKKSELQRKKCIDFANDRSGNLIIIGGVGTGKTHLAAAIINQICYNTVDNISDDDILRFNESGKPPKSTPAYYIRECDLRDCFMKSYNFGDNDTETRKISLCKNVELLCIDDIGVRNNYTDNQLSMLYDIIDDRYNKNLPTLITSNLTPEEIKKNIGDRCYDRLKNNADIISMGGASHRKAKE